MGAPGIANPPESFVKRICESLGSHRQGEVDARSRYSHTSIRSMVTGAKLRRRRKDLGGKRKTWPWGRSITLEEQVEGVAPCLVLSHCRH